MAMDTYPRRSDSRGTSAPLPQGERLPPRQRLLAASRERPGALDGAWWPRSSDLDAEQASWTLERSIERDNVLGPAELLTLSRQAGRDDEPQR